MSDNILYLLEKYFGEFDRRGHDYYFYCPNRCHEYKKKLSVDLEKNKYHCWICGYGGSDLYWLFYKFFKQEKEDWGKYILPSKEGTFEKQADFLSFSNVEQSEEYFTYYFSKYPLVVDVLGKLPDVIVSYLKKKKIKKDALALWAVRYVDGENPSLVVPSFGEGGVIDYYTRRYFSSGEMPKFYKPPKKFTSFNSFWNKNSNSIYLVENVFDAMRFDITSVMPVLGSSVHSLVDFVSLCKEKNKIVKIFFDNDAIFRAFDAKKYLLSVGVEAVVIENVFNKDIEELEDWQLQYCSNNFYTSSVFLPF